MDSISNIIILASLVLLVYLVAKADKQMHNTFFTPFVVLAVPYTILIFLSFVTSYALNFVYLYIPSVITWIIGLTFLWMGGFCISYMTFFFQKNDKRTLISEPSELSHSNYFISFLSLAVIFVMAYNFYQCVSYYGLYKIGDNDFAERYASSGFYGHTYVLAMCLFAYWISVFSSKNVLSFIFIFLLFIVLFIYQVKGWIMLSCLTGIFYRIITGKLKFNIRVILIFLLSSILLFCLIYYIGMVITQHESVSINFYVTHLSKYIYAGIFGYSEYLRSYNTVGNNQYLVTSTFENVLNYFNQTPYTDIVNKIYLPIDDKQIELTNVNTIFGTIHIALGFLSLIIISFAIGIVSYFFMLFKNNRWFFLIYSFLLSTFALGWFEVYFQHLTFYEIILYFLTFCLLFRIKDFICYQINAKGFK